MNYMAPNTALRHYGHVATAAGVEGATPHRLIQMLLDGALEKLAVARGYMERGDTAMKGRNISWAISIIAGLRLSLDMEKGGEIATNLEALYSYMERRLVEANLKNDIAMITEVADLLRNVKEGWDAIPMQFHQRPGLGAVR